jgi:uncharacterized protein involved in exopolysaccharide biosynthesis
MSHPQLGRPRPSDRLITESPDPVEGAEGAILGLVAVLLRRWRFVLFSAVLGVLLAVLPVVLRPRSYEVGASFMPQSRRTGGNMAGLAAQLGINFPQSEGGQSPQFYSELLKSPEMLRTVVTAPLTLPLGGVRRQGTLVDRERAKAPDASVPLLVHRAIARLRGKVAVVVSAKTGIVSFSVRDDDPTLARDIAALLIAQVNRFNLETRQSQATAERRFAEQRLAEATRELRAAETRRQAFVTQNRGFNSSSWLTLQQDRLSREVDNAQQVYSMLAQAYEQAKIDEVRDTPVITVLEHPRVPVLPISRGLALRGLLGLLVGVGIGVLVALVRSRIATMRAAGTPAWLEVEAALPNRRSDGATARGAAKSG